MRYDDSPPPPESASSISPDRRWFVRRSALTIAVASLVPAALAAWVLTQALTGSDADRQPPRAVPLPASHATGLDGKPNP
ncbi:N-acetylmuramoyl-L-alanine amidase, partial [Streptomyces sp. NPDC054838]